MIATNSLFEIYSIYEHTAMILGIESLIMGATLLTLALTLKHGKSHSRPGLIFLSVAMYVLSIINFAECIIGGGVKEHYSLSIVVFAASIELFLLFFAYMSMLCKDFINGRRICIEIGLIALFTTPALLVSQSSHPVLSNVLFEVGVGFYAVKLILDIITYRKQVRRTAAELENFHSEDSSSLLRWVNNTFYMILAIGIVSVVVPMTNLLVLTLYNTFIFFAYFYIYISVIRNIDVFDRSLSAIECDVVESSQSERTPKKKSSFIASRQKFLDNWIANKGYSAFGITVSEVAAQLHTNRNKLSQYLNNELHITYYEWIAGLRMEDAKRQLIEYPDRPIITIAHNVGIEDRYNFGRAFHRFVGMSPTEYRREYFEKISQ